MRLFLLLLFFLISLSLHGNKYTPCQIIGYNNVEEYAIPLIGTVAMDSANLSVLNRKKKIRLLKNCINKYSVCITEIPPHNSNWISEKLISPSNINFNPVKRALLFGMIQYVDKENGNKICIIAMNNFVQAVPWYGVSWINDGKIIKQYELRGARFNEWNTERRLH